MKNEFELIYGRKLPFTPNVKDRVTIDETQSRVNELMGVSDMDVVRQLSKMSPDESVENFDESILLVARMMGISNADIQRYGYGKEPSSEPETDAADQVTLAADVVQVAKLMDVDVEDIRKYGVE